MANVTAKLYAQNQVDIWAQNTEQAYRLIRHMHSEHCTDEQIADMLREWITDGAYDSGWLISSDGEMQAAFGDADGVTMDDIDWSAVIDAVTDRTERKHA